MEDPSNRISELSKTTASEGGRIKRRFHKPLMIIGLTVAVVFAVFIYFRLISAPFDKTDIAYTSITVYSDEGCREIADKLYRQGLIAAPERFELVARLMRLNDFRPGTYYLSPSMDSVEIAKTIVNGLTTSKGFILPPGYTVDQIAHALDSDGFADYDEFLKAAADDMLSEIDFIGTDISGSDRIEGFLLPDSYSVNSDADDSMLILTMLDNFSNFFNDDYRARAEELGLSIRQIVVIASVIEKETAVDKERAAISGVIHNRLNLELDELPDIPLCSPGKNSIIAALYPEENEYTYYVLNEKLDGTHVFTADEEEYDALEDAFENAVERRKLERRLERGQEEEQ